jgi:hypothetical protein
MNNKQTQLTNYHFLKAIGIVFVSLFAYDIITRISPPKSCEQARLEYADVERAAARESQMKSEEMLYQSINGTRTTTAITHVPPSFLAERKKAVVQACGI